VEGFQDRSLGWCDIRGTLSKNVQITPLDKIVIIPKWWGVRGVGKPVQ